VLPLRTLASIQRPRREKVALYAIFGCGTFACIASMVRLHTIYRYTLADDPFRDATLINLWSLIEVNMAIGCASVPALKPVFSRSQRLRSGQRRSGASSGRAGGGRASRISGLSRTGDSGSGAGRSRNDAKGWAMLGGGGSVATATTATTATADVEAAEALPFPPTRPLPPPGAARHGSSATAGAGSRTTPEPESPELSEDSGGMFVFTPLSPRGRAAQRGSTGLEADAVNSSGSMLVIQK